MALLKTSEAEGGGQAGIAFEPVVMTAGDVLKLECYRSLGGLQ